MIITISRQAATNGGLVGRLVAERLGLRVFDRELVDEIARRLQVDPDIVFQFDEVSQGAVQSLLWDWRAHINEEKYIRYLRQALNRIAAENNAVVIGRGANFVLRCSKCLHVRIVAPIKLRTQIYRSYFDVTEREAERRIRLEDKEKQTFIHRLYGAEIDNPENYDLVINLAGLTPEMATELIVRAARMRVAEHMPLDARATFKQHVEVMTRHRRPIRPEVVERQRAVG